MSQEYKDLVRSLLVQDPEGRLPLIKIFTDPWILYFQYKYKIQRPASPMTSEDESSGESSDYSDKEIKDAKI